MVELLVVIGIIAILAGVTLGPITSGIEKARESAGMQTVRSINLLMFSYANDNNLTYLPGSGTENPQSPAINTSEGIANQLLNKKYTSDATIFAINPSHRYTGSTTPYNLTASTIDWDFMGGVTTSIGLTSAAPDQTPIVFSDISPGGIIVGPTSTVPGLVVGLGNLAPFQQNGVAVAYKSNSAQFLKGNAVSSYSSNVQNFISSSFNDTWGAGYDLIKP